jgi:hypothetical protein
MRKISILIIVLLSIFGCRTHCPEFPTNLNYFPYYEGQELNFVNSKKDIQSFTISYKDNSKANSFGYFCKCVCGASSVFHTDENQDSLSIVCNIDIDDAGRGSDITTSSIAIRCYFKYSYKFDDYLAKRFDFGKSVHYNEIYKYVEDTITLETEDGMIVKKIVIVKDKGLVSYTKVDGEVWMLED